MEISKHEDVTLFMRSLIDFEAHVTRRDFQSIFGRENASDLWIKFTLKCDNNTTIFYRILDEEEQIAFDRYILKIAQKLGTQQTA